MEVIMNGVTPICQTPVQYTNKLGKSYSNFAVLDYKIENKILKVFIIYCGHDPNNPEVSALWEKTKSKLFLIRNKSERDILDFSTGLYKQPKSRSAWVHINLNGLDINKEVSVCLHHPPLYEDGGTRDKIEDERDEVLTKVHL